MLSIFCVLVTQVLKVKHPNVSFKIDPATHVSKGKTYAADHCVVKVCLIGPVQVLVVWEYKPRVSGIKLHGIISETMLQAFYKSATLPNRSKGFSLLLCWG